MEDYFNANRESWSNYYDCILIATEFDILSSIGIVDNFTDDEYWDNLWNSAIIVNEFLSELTNKPLIKINRL